MLRLKRFLALSAAVVPLFCLSAFGQGIKANITTPGGTSISVNTANSSRGGNAIAGYVFGAENSANAEELAELVVNNLAATRNYSTPSRFGAREFFRLIDREQARNRSRMLDDRNFCRIGGDNGVQFLVVIDVEKAGRANSVWARILDLDNCSVVATAEYTGLIRNSAEIRTAANTLSSELQHRRMNRRSIQVGSSGGAAVAAAPSAPPPPPPPPPRGNQIAAYVFGIENAKLGEDLSEAIVNGLANSRTYSQPRRGARGFFQAADREQRRIGMNRMLDDRNFCRIGTDYEIEYLVIIDIERAGRGNSIWARILDLETCQIIATGESTALVRNTAEVTAVANEIVAELLNKRVGRRGGGR